MNYKSTTEFEEDGKETKQKVTLDLQILMY